MTEAGAGSSTQVAGFGVRGPRGSRISFDQAIRRKILATQAKGTGASSFSLPGISLKPDADPEEEGVKPLPEDLHVSVTYRKNGRIEISW